MRGLRIPSSVARRARGGGAGGFQNPIVRVAKCAFGVIRPDPFSAKGDVLVLHVSACEECKMPRAVRHSPFERFGRVSVPVSVFAQIKDICDV